MARVIFHRGPDQQGLRADSHLAMGMNRLAIVDSSAHAIPYANEDGTVQLVYNGEVYNHLEIRQRLQGAHRFASTSDAETIVHAYEERGMRMLDDFNGMYAFALADLAKRKLFLVRDKVGEKPLYYAVFKGSLYFASEIKALLTQIETKVNTECLSYRAFEVCTDRETLFTGVHALLPGEFLEISLDDVSDIVSERYWHVMEHLVHVPDDEAYVERELTELLEDAIRVRTGNSVHGFGCLVSGGVDSAMLACMAKPDYLYSCTYDLGSSFDELKYARLVAEHVGMELTVVRPTREQFEAYSEDIAFSLDLPCTWTSFNLFCLLDRVREDCKVTLTGEGVDELFGGYHRYMLLYHDEQIKKLEAMGEYDYLIDKYYGSAVERYTRLVNRCDSPRDEHVNGYLRSIVEPLFEQAGDVVHAMGLVDFYTTMQVLLQMGDRMNMVYSMENRCPFLDPRLVQFAYSMPARFKIRDGITKYIIKKIARKFVPKAIVDRKDKRGFVAPMNVWFGWATGSKYDRTAYRRKSFADWEKVFFHGDDRVVRRRPRWERAVTLST